MGARGHDVVIETDGHDIPLICGLKVDNYEYVVPSDSSVMIGADANGTMTVTFTVFARSVHTVTVS